MYYACVFPTGWCDANVLCNTLYASPSASAYMYVHWVLFHGLCAAISLFVHWLASAANTLMNANVHSV